MGGADSFIENQQTRPKSMKVDNQNAFKYNTITIVERCINTNIIYVGEYPLKCKQSTNEFNNIINV